MRVSPCQPTGVLHTGSPPHTGRAIEVQQRAQFVTGLLFNDKVAVDAQGLRSCQAGNAGVQVAPAGLDAADLGIGERG